MKAAAALDAALKSLARARQGEARWQALSSAKGNEADLLRSEVSADHLIDVTHQLVGASVWYTPQRLIADTFCSTYQSHCHIIITGDAMLVLSCCYEVHAEKVVLGWYHSVSTASTRIVA